MCFARLRLVHARLRRGIRHLDRIERNHGIAPTGAKPDGADDGVRTRDLRLGKAPLYQLSYIRTHEKSYGGASSRARQITP